MANIKKMYEAKVPAYLHDKDIKETAHFKVLRDLSYENHDTRILFFSFLCVRVNSHLNTLIPNIVT